MTPNPLLYRYQTIIDGTACFFAGLPGYPRNFSRDTLIAGIISTDQQLIESQIIMSTLHQGMRHDHLTGEEPGKIHHEYPGVVVNDPYLSTYNACDTTALYLIGLEFLEHFDTKLYEADRQKYEPNIMSAIAYLESHIIDDVFWEYPPEGARHFSLHTTYWKDSIVPSAHGKEEPNYPVAYALVQFQVARSLLAAHHLLHRRDLAVRADRMFRKGIKLFISEQEFCVEQDETRRLEQASSDELHALAYIPKKYSDLLPFRAIAERVKPLITTVGIACTPKEISDQLPDTYHGYVVWVFEQAMIHYGCLKFGLTELAKVTLGCVEHIEDGHELLSISPPVRSIGNTHQLWSVAAKIYFSEAHSLRQTRWL